MAFVLQNFLFEHEPSRRELLSYRSDKSFSESHVQVFRNHSFELIEHTIGAYLEYSGLNINFSYSGYDDSLSFRELDVDSDLLIIWLDATRYKGISIQDFLKQRVEELKKRYTKPILLIPFGTDIDIQMTGVLIWNLSEIQSELGDKFEDRRSQAITGTALSGKALGIIARKMGLRYLPALLKPAIKGIVVDFDNTLYSGVLGENGIDGVVLTPGHKALQSELKTLAEKGFFLCGASKNEMSDVLELLEQRKDFPLKKEDFTKLCVSWNPKAKSIEEIANYLNINSDSLIFIDDNIGELTSVKMAHPQIKLICAKENAEITCRVLSEYPGLMQFNSNAILNRKADVQANEQRKELQASMSQEEYIRSLEIHLKFEHDNCSQIARIAELANKTNQFIFNYKRYSQSDVELRISNEEYSVVSVSLSDKLSDSGLVGVCVGKKQADYVEIEECFISCRALGRGIDDMIVLGAIWQVANQLGMKKVKVSFQKGQRNTPAEQFIKDCLIEHIAEPKEFSYEMPQNLVCVDIEY